jgi:hypothetical protein
MNIAEFCAALAYRDVPELPSAPPMALLARQLSRIRFASRAFEAHYFALLTSEYASIRHPVRLPTLGDLTKAVLLDYAARTTWMNATVFTFEPAHELERRAPLFCTGLVRDIPPGRGARVLYGRYENFMRSASLAVLPHDASDGFVRLEQLLRSIVRPGHSTRCVAYGREVGADVVAESLGLIVRIGHPPELLLLETEASLVDSLAQRAGTAGVSWEPIAETTPPTGPNEPRRSIVLLAPVEA